MPDTSAAALLREALDFLEALRIEVSLIPIAGRWELVLAEETVTAGDLIARAIRLGMLGAGTPLQ